MQDSEFDKELRGRLARFRSEYDPTHWDALAQRLDAAEQTAVTRRRERRRWLVAAVLTFSLLANGWLSWQLLDPFGVADAPTATVPAQPTNQAPANPLTNPAADPLTATQPSTTTARSAPARTYALPSAPQVAAHGQAAPQATPAASNSAESLVERVARLLGYQFDGGSGGGVATPPSLSQAFARTQSAAVPPTGPVPPASVLRHNSPPAAAAYAAETSAASADAESTPPEAAGARGLRLGPFASPDVSVVDGNTRSGFGFTGGAMVQKQVGKRWAVGVGTAFSRKQYAQDFAGTSAPGARATLSAVRSLSSVEADMSVLSVPVSLQYNVYDSEASDVFLRTSLSANYFVDRDFDYEYVTMAAPSFLQMGDAPSTEVAVTTETERTSGGESSRWYGGLELSAGYERTLSDRLALEMAPWSQIPLTTEPLNFEKIPVTLGLRTVLHFRLD